MYVKSNTKNKIGVLAIESKVKPPFGSQTVFFKEMVNLTKNLGVEIFFFSPLKFNKKKNIVQGFYYNNNVWENVSGSLPEVVYDRVFPNTKLDYKKTLEFKNQLKIKKIPIINPVNFSDLLADKIKFHNFLIKNKLPTLKTKPLKKIISDNFFEQFQNSNEYYIKPVFGIGGAGIYILEIVESEYILKNSENQKLVKSSDLKGLYKFITSLINVKDYFIQPKASVININNSPFDVRVLIQNLGNNDYRVMGMGIRIGKPYSYVSNLNSGGSALPMDLFQSST